MSGKNLTSSLCQLLLKYKQLPYISMKKNSRRYMIPHKPLRPKVYYFNIATNAIKQHSLKYNQYFSPQKLWQKVSQKFEQKISDKEKTEQMINEVEYKKSWQQYNKRLREYNVKYKEPLKLMNVNSYCMFRREFYRKAREEKMKSNEGKEIVGGEGDNTSKPIGQLQSVNNKKKKTSHRYLGSQESIKKINQLKVSQVWLKMSQEEKKVYEDQLIRLREENECRIREFIRNHQVPVVKKYSTMSRFLARYAAVYQLRLTDPALYQKYRQLPQQQKQQLKQQAIKMNRQGKQRLSQFLSKWNISKQQLEYIVSVSDKYEKTKKASRVEARRRNRKIELNKLVDEEEQYDEMDQYQQEEDDYSERQHQQTVVVSDGNVKSQSDDDIKNNSNKQQ